jgi:hypothetical protein
MPWAIIIIVPEKGGLTRNISEWFDIPGEE